ncbi:Glutamate--tRNA ligase [bioreactor metagenome]|uniref:Glutamate--tRNA ligase n=1 Tax=bioreactor metagenome TaxID=1076179 RepID=A0A645FBK3_9ZZZZ
MAEPYIKTVVKNPNIDLLKISNLVQSRAEVLTDIPERIDFIDELPEYSTELYIHKKMKTTEENSLDSLKAALPILETISDWKAEVLHDEMMKLVVTLGIKNGQMLWPIRTAISGKAATPGGAFEIAEILGKEETIKRIKVGIEKLTK